jgi:hypothetical protein
MAASQAAHEGSIPFTRSINKFACVRRRFAKNCGHSRKIDNRISRSPREVLNAFPKKLLAYLVLPSFEQ